MKAEGTLQKQESVVFPIYAEKTTLPIPFGIGSVVICFSQSYLDSLMAA